MNLKLYKGLTLDYSRDSLMTDFSLTLLRDYYMLPTESSPQESFARAALCFSAGDMEFAQRIYDYASKKWFMFASPVLSNSVLPGEKMRGLPISCFLSWVPDTLPGLINHTSELRWLSVLGGGVGGHLSSIRAVSDKAPGVIPYVKTIDSDMNFFRQGAVRRGAYAAYLDISHPDLVEFLNMRVPTGGDASRKAFTIHNAINITDKFMDAVMNNERWHLTDPNDGSIRESHWARELWQRILETRFRTGEPYICYTDEANRRLPQNLKDMGLKINGSNLCAEIMLPTSDDRTAVCCLSSLNLEYYDDWKDTSLVADCVRLLDNVLQFFIDNAPDTISKARNAAIRERAIGLGTMGFHSYLQRKGFAFEGIYAKGVNLKIFENIKAQAVVASQQLAVERGEYPDGIGTGMRNSHLMAIAPNANNSIMLNTSPSIEPLKANAYTHRTRAGSFLVKNVYLEQILEDMGMNTSEVWTNIITNEGSIQHLDFLDDKIKKVFKTALELDQRWIIDLARDRQQFICQGQSVNLFFPAGSEKSYVNSIHLRAFSREGTGVPLKSLYYLRSTAGATAGKISGKDDVKKLDEQLKTKKIDDGECIACSG